MADIRDISDEEARRLIDLEEGHYQDVKRIAIAPAKLSESVSAFANSSGGELFIGVGEDKTSSEERRFWHGFADQEAANAHIQVVEGLLPLGNHYQAEFLRSRVATGLVMHLIVFKTRNIVLATNSVPYVRKGPQNLPIKGEDALRRLRLDKGIETFEDETIRVEVGRISESETMGNFLRIVGPLADPEAWIRKQNLVYAGQPTVAGLLLFDDEPQAALPKRSAIKLYRYKTKLDEGQRETLAADPLTVEGCLYQQISNTKSLSG